MKTKVKFISHAAALLLGICLAALVSKQRSAFIAASGSNSYRSERNRAERDSRTFPNGKGNALLSSRAAVYRQAWRELAKEPLNRPDRIAIQAKLLEQWAKTDLHGAIEAYLGETWDQKRLAIEGGDPLSNAFAPAFEAEPMQTWSILAGSDMAMARRFLAGVWGQVVGQKDPAMVISVVAEMPPSIQGTRLMEIFRQEMPVEKRQELLEKLGKAGDARQFEKWVTAMRCDLRVDPSQSIDKWSTMEKSPERTVEMSAWATSMATLDREKFSTEWAKVPEEDRAQAARLLLSRVDNHSPVLLEAFDRAIASGQWEVLRDGAEDKLRGFSGSGTPELREWALTLPEREDTRRIYNLAISESLLRDPEGGRQWLESLPAGSWHRNAGFVEMVLGSIWVRGDLARAREAAGLITDPRMAEEASKVIYDWQLLTRRSQVDH